MRHILPEWAPHKALWTAWPSRPDLWPGILEESRREVAAMVYALAEGDHIKILATPGEAEASARDALRADNITVIPAQFGDIWFRDIAPLFARADNNPVALTFRTNGWGGKYIYAHDDEVAAFIAQQSGTPALPQDMILEGGRCRI